MKEFTAEVHHLGRRLGTGAGKSKKEAEQQAAKKALEKFSRACSHNGGGNMP
jgi:ribonuclease-3